jgi:group I intron endonuclease
MGLENMIGIYKIENKINGKVYIGQSGNIKERWYNHKSELKHNRHCNRYLQSACNKYGLDNFEFSIIEECSMDIIDEREIYWIAYYDSCNTEFGYNLSTGGDSPSRGVKLTQEQKDYMSKAKNPEQVVQIDFNGNVVKVWRSATHAQRTLNNIRARSILQCARHVVYQANGYIWFYKKEYDQIDFNVEKYMLEHKRYFDIPIMQYDLYGNLIKEWSCKQLKEEQNQFDYSVVRACCNREKRTYQKHIWKYKYDTEFKLTKEYLYHCRKTASHYWIDQFDMNMNFIKRWYSDELIKSDEYDINSIHRVCKYKSANHRGYIWREYIPNIEELV